MNVTDEHHFISFLIASIWKVVGTKAIVAECGESLWNRLHARLFKYIAFANAILELNIKLIMLYMNVNGGADDSNNQIKDK